jgi:hypothetical protein
VPQARQVFSRSTRLADWSLSNVDSVSMLDMTTTESFTANGLLGTMHTALPKASLVYVSGFSSNGLLGGPSTVIDVSPGITSSTLGNESRLEDPRDTMLVDDGFTVNGLLGGQDTGESLSLFVASQ